MANEFKIKQAEQRKQQAQTELLQATSGGLFGREQAIKAYCQKTGEGRDQAIRIIENRSSGSGIRHMFNRG